MKHIVCYSGGASSALVAVEVTRKYGMENVILLNHDIAAHVEDADIKRFKQEISEHLNLPITYANMDGWETLDQFDVCVKAKAFKVGNGQELCTNRIKTGPFMKYLAENFPEKDCIIYYGFDANETKRIQRRSTIMGAHGYKTDYPLALWKQRTIHDTSEIGIMRPLGYGTFKHANCKGCLKAGLQHWYVIYCTEPCIWNKAKWAEEEIGYSIHGEEYLEDLETLFEKMRYLGFPATEHIQSQAFWASVKKAVSLMDAGQMRLFDAEDHSKPCECVF